MGNSGNNDEQLKVLQNQNYYERIGVEKSASSEEIKKAYRKLALSLHPDRCTNEDQAFVTARFQLINEAYMQLKDISKRYVYDNWLDSGNTGRFSEQDDMGIHWETGPGWGPKLRNLLLIVAMIMGVSALLLREGTRAWGSQTQKFCPMY
eukprot:m.40134 g.40134  ORF g.40134 m.40134 type:complete len:150 (-) comp9630_c0_seq2:1782-2231(-)